MENERHSPALRQCHVSGCRNRTIKEFLSNLQQHLKEILFPNELSVKEKILSLQKRKEKIEDALNLFAKEVGKIENSELVIYADEQSYGNKFTLGLNIDVSKI